MSKLPGRIPLFPHFIMERVFPGGFTFRDEANAIVATALQSGPLAEMLGSASGAGSTAAEVKLSASDVRAVVVHATRAIEDLMQHKFYNQPDYYSQIVLTAQHRCRGWHRRRSEDQAFLKSRRHSAYADGIDRSSSEQHGEASPDRRGPSRPIMPPAHR